MQAGRLTEAQRSARNCLTLFWRSPSAHLLAARLARLQEDYPDAEAHLNECVRLQGGASDATQLEWVLGRAQSGELDEQAAGLWRCIDNGHPESEQILSTMARTYMRELRFQSALQCLNRWLVLDPDNPRALEWRGWTWDKLDDHEHAVRDYQQAVALDPLRWETRLRLVNLLLDDGTPPDDILPHLEDLRRRQPNHPQVQVALARCFYALGRIEEARQLLDGVVTAHPDDAEALFQRGNLELQTGQPAEAEPWLRRVVESDPVAVQAAYALALCLQRQGHRQQEAENALEHYRQRKADKDRLEVLLLEAGSSSATVALELGNLLLRFRQERPGLYWLQVALQRDPHDPAPHQALAAYYETNGDREKADQHRRAAGGPALSGNQATP
jgi:tetratricopeptide (TPR) repeat protein